MTFSRWIQALATVLLCAGLGWWSCNWGSDARSGVDARTEPRTCLGPSGGESSTTATLDDGALGKATLTMSGRQSCQRTYTLQTSAALRDQRPGNPRIFGERAERPIVRSGHDLFDALYALALEEVNELSVAEISDGAFYDGAPVDCGAGGCFETGRLWSYVWTRDTAYALDLGMSTIDPLRSLGSLEFKLSERRGGGDLQIVQDTGSGGSYPVSTDRVAWALGAWALLHELEDPERSDFRDRALEALTNTLEQDRRLVWDESDGLYFGEQSFLDWREQSYPTWAASDLSHIAMSKALSTNLLHLRAHEITVALAEEGGDLDLRDRFALRADALRMAIRNRFWLEEEGMFSAFITTTLDPAPTRRYDLLASSLAIVGGVATDAQADRMLAGYPHYGPGAPVLWPQQQFTRVYHNRGEWPFVSAYWLRAAAAADSDAVAERMVRALMRGAALNLSNMENFEAGTGAAWLAEGDTSGPVVNSQRQLWSVAGYLSMVQHTIFGLHAGPKGLNLAPYVTRGMRSGIFAESETIALNDYPYRGKHISVIMHLPSASAGSGAYALEQVQLNGETHSALLDPAELKEQNLVELWLVDDASSTGTQVHEVSASDWRDVFGPRTPSIVGVSEVGGRLELELSIEGDSASDVSMHIYRDGQRVATGLAGTTTSWTDATSEPGTTTSYCYAVELSYASGNYSQHSPPRCWWQAGDAGIQIIAASSLTNTGGQASTNHGRFHYENWGDEGHALVASGVTASKTGPHLIQVVYGNGAGPIETGISCAVKRVQVIDEQSGAIAGQGALVMPQRASWSSWGESNFVSASLESGRSYRVVIESDAGYSNMSVFSHFEGYTAGIGGSQGTFNRVNIAELRLLAR